MKFTVTFKTPDAVESGIEASLVYAEELSEEAKDSEMDKMKSLANRYVEYGEYVTLEFDTDKNSVTVLPRS